MPLCEDLVHGSKVILLHTLYLGVDRTNTLASGYHSDQEIAALVTPTFRAGEVFTINNGMAKTDNVTVMYIGDDPEQSGRTITYLATDEFETDIFLIVDQEENWITQLMERFLSHITYIDWDGNRVLAATPNAIRHAALTTGMRDVNLPQGEIPSSTESYRTYTDEFDQDPNGTHFFMCVPNTNGERGSRILIDYATQTYTIT